MIPKKQHKSATVKSGDNEKSDYGQFKGLPGWAATVMSRRSGIFPVVIVVALKKIVFCSLKTNVLQPEFMFATPTDIVTRQMSQASARPASVLLFLFLLSLPMGSCRSLRDKDTVTWVTVTKVIDGDTFWANDGTPETLKVRLIGLDAPETRKSQRKEIGYYGKESMGFLHTLIAGKKVRLEYDVERHDQYRRTLAYVYLENGTFVNAELIRRGYAVVLTVPPNVKYADEFIKLQRKARRQNLGLWGKKG